MSRRVTENSKSGIIGALWAFAAYSYTFLKLTLDWHLPSIMHPEYLKQYVEGLVVLMTGGATLAAYNRDRPSERQPEVVTQTAPQPEVVQAPVKKNYFSIAETDCKGKNCDCDDGPEFTGLHPTVLAIANDLREKFGPGICNSGYRCVTHNEREGGSDGSYHVKKMAMDLRFPNAEPVEVYQYLIKKYPAQYGFGLYRRFVHIDCRTTSWARKSGANNLWQQFAHDELINLA